MKKVTVTGKSIDEAVQSGLDQLKATREQVNIVVLEHPTKGLFGLIGGKDAKVELELLPDPISEAVNFLKEVTATMNLNVEIEREDGDQAVKLNISGKDLGLIIGRRGQTLDALQYLVNIVANRASNTHVKVVLDAENFRERREQTLIQLANRLASRVSKTKKDVTLEPMSPHERKVIHSVLQNNPRVKTYSKGDEPNRRVVITLK
ncbi:protein jag [Xylanibacillus composti]|uniref:RNA-binding protein KhpB n=1 Tax=Xylanibacillus composti TaxID=1572762 RepID=A0A8J4H5R8_9BACL|nr:RNA-binding cell elongation regulator Jag/EloR [Xylanibacillus composti]MDT9725187.1 protein jag [Xylanibacillus composti]GIQ70036.1 DNA-binding protein [Xylanibacillus composti]